MDVNGSSRVENDEIEIDLMEIVAMLWHYAWMIVISAAVVGIVALLLSKFVVTDIYESNTKIVILNKQNNNNITYSDMQLNTQLTKDYAQLIKTRHVLETVIESCGLKESYGSLAGRVQVTNVSDTRIISITVSDPDPQMAQRLANEICTVASAHIKDVMDLEAVNVADEANLPERPASPNVGKWTILGAATGAFLCIAILMIRFLLDDTIKTSEDVERYLGLSTLALIPIRDEELAKKGTKKSHGSAESNPVENLISKLGKGGNK